MAYSPDGTRIATGTDDSNVTVWDADNGQLVLTLTGRATDTTSLAFMPDGKRLLTGAYDDTTRLWGHQRGRQQGLAVPGRPAAPPL